MYIEINNDSTGKYVGGDLSLYLKRRKATVKKPKSYGSIGTKINYSL